MGHTPSGHGPHHRKSARVDENGDVIVEESEGGTEIDSGIASAQTPYDDERCIFAGCLKPLQKDAFHVTSS